MLYSELGFERASVIFGDPGNFPMAVRLEGREQVISYEDFARMVIQGIDFEIDDAVVDRILDKYRDRDIPGT